MSHVPDWWQFVLLTLAAYRVWRLGAWDKVTERWRFRLVRFNRLGYRAGLAEFMQCPWCLGFWIVLAWWAAWLAWPHGTLVAAAPFALSTAVGTLGRLDD